MSTSSVATIMTTMTGNISTILTDNIPAVLVIVAGLIGLGFLIRFVKRHVGKKA